MCLAGEGCCRGRWPRFRAHGEGLGVAPDPWAMPGVGLVAAWGVLAGLPQPLCVQAQLSAGIFKLTDAELKRGPGKQ